MIGKGELIVSIIELYDALEASKRERDKRQVPAVIRTADTDGRELSKIDARMLEAGRIKVYESCMYSWRECKATKDEETGAISVMPYGTWLKEKVNSVPDYMSKTDFYEYFADRLQADYEREKQDAIAKLAVKGDDE